VRLPRATCIILLACVLAWLLPGPAQLLIYDRAAILDGALWRLLTGHLVHFSPAHLCYDLLAFGLAGWLVEQRRYPGLAPLYIGMPLAIGATLLIVNPGMAYFGGMSGMACGVTTFAALHGLHEDPRWRDACAVVLAVLTVRLGFDLVGGPAFMLLHPADALVAVPASHAAGSLFALLLYAVQRARRLGPDPVFP